ncbi:MAG: Lipid III flippase [Sodalis sp. Psp]|nr:Lipid III flippase [Sodalis sp. Psp]MCR3756837.1 Lipid III flippase [Sodalis sp. Ppy]
MLQFVFPAVIAVSLVLWLLRDVMIRQLFSIEFSTMRSLFA